MDNYEEQKLKLTQEIHILESKLNSLAEQVEEEQQEEHDSSNMLLPSMLDEVW